MPEARDLDHALDELYGVTPKEFVGTRKSLAAELRTGGDATAAKQLAEARRPTTAAWALNQLARAHPELVDELIERGAELRRVQSRAATGGADRLREATAERRAALDAAADAALALAGEITANPEAHRDAITATLEAGSADESIGEVVRAGRLVREVEGAVGFPEIATLSLVQGGRAPKAKATADKRAVAEAREPKPAPDVAARVALESAEAEARRAAQRASELAVKVGEAEQVLDDRRAELDQAQAALREAQSAARRVRNDLEAAERAASAADRAVEKARRKLP